MLLSVTGLLALKVVLEIGIGGVNIFAKVNYAAALFARLVWHAVFFALFLIVQLSPTEVASGTSTYLDLAGAMAIVYGSPVVLAGALKMLFPQCVWQNGFLNALDGTRDLYIGRHTAQKWTSFLAYGAFWTVLLGLKLLFNLQLMIKPLMGPTVEISKIHVATDDALLASHKNVAFIVAMWAPVFLVYLYDTQIWLAIMQSIVG